MPKHFTPHFLQLPPPAVFHDKAKRTQQANLLGAEGKFGRCPNDRLFFPGNSPLRHKLFFYQEIWFQGSVDEVGKWKNATKNGPGILICESKPFGHWRGDPLLKITSRSLYKASQWCQVNTQYHKEKVGRLSPVVAVEAYYSLGKSLESIEILKKQTRDQTSFHQKFDICSNFMKEIHFKINRNKKKIKAKCFPQIAPYFHQV